MDGKRVTRELNRIYKKFAELRLGGQKIATPYRINDDPRNGAAFQGKSSPEVITQTAVKLADREQVDLTEISEEQIRKFLEDHKLGIDCSGFAYRMLDFASKKILKKDLRDAAGLDHVGNTNVELLTSSDFTEDVNNLADIKPGDLIKVRSAEKPPHVMVVLEIKDKKIIYAHSSKNSTPSGVHISEIIITNPGKPINGQKWQEEYLLSNWNSGLGDGVHRLKIFI
jgi:hypothetical protein